MVSHAAWSQELASLKARMISKALEHEEAIESVETEAPSSQTFQNCGSSRFVRIHHSMAYM